jgi:hypothetical protein
MLEHIVLFKFKADAPIVDITAACLAMQAQIPGVLEINFGASLGARTYAGCLDRARGYTHAEIVRFRCARDLETYASHAAHVNFVSVFVRPHLESAVCFLLFFRFTEYCTSAADYLPAVICRLCFTPSFRSMRSPTRFSPLTLRKRLFVPNLAFSASTGCQC